MYDRLEEYSRRIMSSKPVVLTKDQRRVACNAMVEKLMDFGVRVIALSVGAGHYHIRSDAFRRRRTSKPIPAATMTIEAGSGARTLTVSIS